MTVLIPTDAALSVQELLKGSQADRDDLTMLLNVADAVTGPSDLINTLGSSDVISLSKDTLLARVGNINAILHFKSDEVLVMKLYRAPPAEGTSPNFLF